MRTSIKHAFALGAVTLLLGLGAAAQEPIADNMDILRAKLDADKKLLIAANLILTESEAAAFWPIYDEYQAELETINERLARLILEYAEAYNSYAITAEKADALMSEAFAVEEAEVALRKKYWARLDGKIPAIEAARYLQLESKIRALVRFDLAAEIPLAD